MSDRPSLIPGLDGQLIKCLNCGAEQRLEFSVCGSCGCRLIPQPNRDAATRPQRRRTSRATPSLSIVAGAGRQKEAPDPAEPKFDDVVAEPFALTHKPGPDPLIGFVVAGRYRIIERLGRGGMGVVYKVEHTELGKLLAIKLLTGELGNERQVVRRFKREAELASRLSHPNTVQVFDFGSCDGLTYLVMELVHGHDLAWLLAHEGPLRAERAARILLQVCSSLAEAHRVGIVHRDVKPGNIMVARAPDGEEIAKVLDFGLAKLREAPELNELTGGGAVVGTPLYMSPEQIMGRPVDGRTDIYAMGAVMYRMLTGEPPFKNASGISVLARHLHEEPQPPHERKPELGIPHHASEIVLRALEKKPAKRYQRVEELQEALLGLLADTSEAHGQSLLNASRLQRLHAEILRSAALEDTEPAHAALPAVPRKAIATRDEVEAFRRKLVRQKWIGIGIATLVVSLGVAVGMRAWQRAMAPPAFSGVETEENNQPSQANDLPIGRTITGTIGKRIDEERSDRDFFRVTVPPDTPLISIRTTALPNMAMCTVLYQDGEQEASARFCVGRPRADLVIPAYRIQPGTWFVAVMQDRERYGLSEAPGVVENVSDSYSLTIDRVATPPEGWEVEPNDQPRAATKVGAGQTVRGNLAWARDEDVVCAAGPEEPVRARWVVHDGEERLRARGAVLEATVLSGVGAGAPIRVHSPHSKGGVAGPVDVTSPWRSEPFQTSARSDGVCLRLRLTDDPWAGDSKPGYPPAGDEPWAVTLESVP